MANFGSTNTKPRSLQNVLDAGNPNDMDAAMAQLDIGTVFTPLKRTFTGLTAAASFDLTAIDGTGEITGPSNPLRLAANIVRSLRVTASGTAATVGSYFVSDAGGTAVSAATSGAAGIALISDDGKTLTFPTTITAFTIQYMPRTLSAAQMAADFAP